MDEPLDALRTRSALLDAFGDGVGRFGQHLRRRVEERREFRHAVLVERRAPREDLLGRLVATDVHGQRKGP